MAAFNYRQLIQQVPPRTWKFYFQPRQIELPAEHDWNMPVDKLVPALIKATEALDEERRKTLFAELRRVHELANRRGVDALRNVARPNSALHEDFPTLSSDTERALWAMINWPEIFDTAEAIYSVNLRIGKRGWKPLNVQPGEMLFRAQEDIQALERALAEAFTPRKGTPRACQIDTLDRHLDGALQLGILIEDSAQRQLEFGEDNRAHWRDIRPPLRMDVVIHPASGVIDVMAPGGAKAREALWSLAQDQSQQDPTFRTTLSFTRLTAEEALKQLRSLGFAEELLPSPSTMAEVLNRNGFRLRSVVKAKPQKKSPRRTPSLPISRTRTTGRMTMPNASG